MSLQEDILTVLKDVPRYKPKGIGATEAKVLSVGEKADDPGERVSPTRRPKSARLQDPHLRRLEDGINWEQVGDRLRSYRLAKGLSVEEMAAKCGIGKGIFGSLEGGRDRKTTNYLWQICDTLRISKAWLFKGTGNHDSEDPPELLPATLLPDRGAGIRRRPERVAAEEGCFSDEPLDFVMAIDAYKRFNNLTFVSWTEAFEILLALGYRRVAVPTINPKKADGMLLKRK